MSLQFSYNELDVSAGLPKRSSIGFRLGFMWIAKRRAPTSLRLCLKPPGSDAPYILLSVDESERTERLARVLAQAEYVWDDREQARVWLSRPHRELSQSAPLRGGLTSLHAVGEAFADVTLLQTLALLRGESGDHLEWLLALIRFDVMQCASEIHAVPLRKSNPVMIG